MLRVPSLLLVSTLIAVGWLPAVRADELSERDRVMVERGLEFLARVQHRDGHWEANGGHYPTAMTALAGMAMLMEGSTIREGKYCDNVRRAVDWFMDRTSPTGMIGNTRHPTDLERYMYGHGFGMLFLACAYGEEEDADRRKKLEKILTRAVEFTGKAQTNRGGWGYLSAADGNNFDEGSVTVTQLQALRAAKNAGIVVPKSIIDNAVKYLHDCTTERGGVIYSLTYGQAFNGQERPALGAAAICCAYSAGDYSSKYAQKWIKFSQQNIAIDKSGRDTFHWEYTHYYYAQVNYMLGEDGYAKLFPGDKSEPLKWSKYKQVIFDFLHSRQAQDGSWNISNVGPVYTTGCVLGILQLDNATLPIHQR
jgi:hypothetical protein